jgi:excisionase family DNA binding protein
MTEPRYLTAEEAAAYLRVPSLKAFYDFLRRHDVPTLRRGRQLLFDRQDLDAWLRDPTMRRPAVTALRAMRQGHR